MTAPKTHTTRVGGDSVIAQTVCGLYERRAECVPQGQATCDDCYPRTRPCAPLHKPEREQLFAWVRARCKLNPCGAISVVELASAASLSRAPSYDDQSASARSDERVMTPREVAEERGCGYLYPEGMDPIIGTLGGDETDEEFFAMLADAPEPTGGEMMLNVASNFDGLMDDLDRYAFDETGRRVRAKPGAKDALGAWADRWLDVFEDGEEPSS